MSEPPAEGTILVVTGSNLKAERLDRPLAYRVREAIDAAGDQDAGRLGVVLSDIWYLNNEELHERPVISVGGPGVNALSQYLWRRLPTALFVEGVLMIQMDVAFQDMRASVWGMDHATTIEAVQTFLTKDYLARFLRAAWGQDA
jgi:hypothetical protein